MVISGPNNFGAPLVIQGGKVGSVLKPAIVRISEPKSRGCKTVPETKTTGPETHGYPLQTRSAAKTRYVVQPR